MDLVSEDGHPQNASARELASKPGRAVDLMARILAMTTTSLADAKNRLSEIIQSTQDTHERFVITKNGRPAAALIAVDDLEALEETVEILSDPKLVSAIRKGLTEAARGDFATEEELRSDLARRRSRG
jgi:antitoxin YefM